MTTKTVKVNGAKTYGVELVLTFVLVKIYINKTPFVFIRRSEFKGFQSWKNDHKYSIEFYLENQSILTEFDKIDLWKEVLQVLDNHLS